MRNTHRFHWADYLLFTASVLLGAFISIYHAVVFRKTSSTADYLMGGRNMSVLPVAASLVVSIVSAIFVLGFPAEAYSFGCYAFFWIFGVLLANAVACLFYLPVYHRLQVTSAYEYLERRFSKEVRTACSIITMAQTMLYSSVAMLAPSIAINQATGLPTWACIVLSAVVCTFYTTLGGFRTVLWTDTVQCLIILTGMTATLIKGCTDVGGLGKVFNVSFVGRRTQMVNMIPDFTSRWDNWTWLFGTFPSIVGIYATAQWSVQRFCSVRKVHKAQLAVLCTAPILLLLQTLAVGLGLLAFTYYLGCDPLLSGRITTRDQTLPILVMDVFHRHPGMPGIFLSSVFSAALSTLSSMQNSFATVLLEDIVKPIHLRCRGRLFSDTRALIISKVTVVLAGAMIASLSLLAANTGKLLIQLSFASLMLGAAPVLGVFSLGLFCSFSNTKGAISGLCSGLFVLGWLIIGTMTVPKSPDPVLPISTELCQDNYHTNLSTMPFGNHTIFSPTTFASTLPISQPSTTIASVIPISQPSGLNRFYKITHQYYGVVGFVPALVVGVFVSLLTGGYKDRKIVEPDVLFSFRKDMPWCNGLSEETRTPEQGRTDPTGLDDLHQEKMLINICNL